MVCTPRMSLLSEYPGVIYVFGCMFIVISITATTSNILVLAIIKQPGNQSRSNKILATLAISDLLVGCLLSPLTAWQVLSGSSLDNCVLDDIRVFLTLALTGTSVMTLAIVALDRYVLLTRLAKYKHYLSNCKLIVLVCIAWLLPIFGACVRFVGRYPYLSMVIFILIGPLILLIISYILITIAVRKQEKKLLEYEKKVVSSTQELTVAKSLNDAAVQKQVERSCRKKRSDIKLAKTVTVLIICYLICVVPLSIWAMVGMINIDNDFISEKAWQMLYISAILLALFNSSINPAIYFLKTPTFKKGLRRLWKKQTDSYENSMTDSNMKSNVVTSSN